MHPGLILVALGILLAVVAVVARLTIIGVLLYYFLFDAEALLAWASKWWQALVAAAGILYITSGFSVNFNNKD